MDDLDLYAVLRVVLGIIGAICWARILLLAYPRVRRTGRSGESRLRMMTIVALLAMFASLLLLSSIYNLLANPPHPQPIPLVIGVILQTMIALGGYVLVRTWPREGL